MRIFISLIFIFFIQNVFGQQVMLELPWGEAPRAVGLIELPEGRYGPQSFKIQGDEIQILDNGNQSIKIFNAENEQIINSISSAARDFALFSKTEYALNVNNEVQYFSHHKLQYKYGKKKIIRSLHIQKDNLHVRFSDGTELVRHIRSKKQDMFAGQDGGIGQRFRVIRRTGAEAEVQTLDNAGSTKKIWTIDFRPKNLASVQFLGQDRRKNIFIHTEFFKSQIPLRIERQVMVLDSTGAKIVTYAIPLNNYAYVQNDLYVDEQGRLFQLYVSREGVRVLKWILPEKNKQHAAPPIEYPEEYDQSEFEAREAEQEARLDIFGSPDQTEAPLSSVTPDQALATADAYVQLHWNCNSTNLTNGIITDSYGYKVRTPDWLYVGNLQRVPYKWGGFQTVQQFVDGVSAGKYAGDNYTSKSSGTPSAVGVDCSGFVSRCWNLSSHYSTRQMPDITIAYDNWDQTRPGDACHKIGHVRLIVGHAPDGSLDMVESAGFNWRVSYTNYRYSSITAYTPRYYKNMEGTPGRIPQPVLQGVVHTVFTDISWQAAARETISEFILEKSDDGQNWQELSAADADSSHFKQDTNDGQAVYYRMFSIASADTSSQSIPSDTYGLYVNSAQPKILVVDGFDRTADSHGSWAHNYHSFAAVHGRVLQNLGIPFETVANEAVVNGIVALEDYPVVIWILGDESTADETFDNTEQTLVSAYLRQGGRLFVSGSEIAWDLDYKGSSTDKDFIRNFLKADLNTDDAASYTVTGIAGTPFAQLSLHYDDGSHGIYKEDYPDALNPQKGGQAALKYANGKIAAVYYSGLFPEATSQGQLFYMGFPFETIYDWDERNQLMGSVLSWFGMQITAIAANEEKFGDDFRLYGNYPNPFNGQTIIRCQVPEAGLLTLRIYNVLGQQISLKEKPIIRAGKQEFLVDAAPFASGEYFYKISFRRKASVASKNGRFLYIK